MVGFVMNQRFGTIFAVFFFLAFVFVPLQFDGFAWQNDVTLAIFSKPVAFLQELFFTDALAPVEFSSDTIALNLLLVLLFVLAVGIGLALRMKKFDTQRLVDFSRTIAVYYLAFVLLKYGFDKIFKAQFYLPEPNILYSLFGNLTKDTLYWSTLGTSRTYCILIGTVELATGFLLLLTRTRVLGLLVAVVVLLQIILINVGFDISVKTFSCLLLAATIFAVYPNLKSIYAFLIRQKTTQLPTDSQILKNEVLKIGFKTFAIGFLFLQVLYPFLASRNFNDDAQSRPFLHGAYEVISVVRAKDTIKEMGVSHLYIHRNDYLILQRPDFGTTDYHFKLNRTKNQFVLEDYNRKKIIVDYRYHSNDSLLMLRFQNQKEIEITCKAMNWRKLPALRDDFHFAIDQVK